LAEELKSGWWFHNIESRSWCENREDKIRIKIREMHRDVLENAHRGNVTLKAADGERQCDESTVMAELSGNRMVETSSEEEEPPSGPG
jgi:hypothetical protein